MRRRSARCVFGWFCVRLSGVYLAMLTLAFAQIVWSVVFQWDGFTGGSNGMVGIWPAAWLGQQDGALLCSRSRCTVAGCLLLRRIAARAVRSGAARRARFAAARRRDRHRRAAGCSGWRSSSRGAFAGLAGGLFAFSKGSISPETLASRGRSTAW